MKSFIKWIAIVVIAALMLGFFAWSFVPGMVSRELSKKMGGPVNIDVNSDPEFVSLLRKALNQLDDRYQAVLNQAKEQLSSSYQT